MRIYACIIDKKEYKQTGTILYNNNIWRRVIKTMQERKDAQQKGIKQKRKK